MEKKNWVTGETITADGLNRTAGYQLVEGTNLILSCSVVVTDVAESITEFDESSIVYDGEYTHNGDYLQFQGGLVLPDRLVVVFDNVSYMVEKQEDNGYCVYGARWNGDASAYDFSEYPFSVTVEDYSPANTEPHTDLFVNCSGALNSSHTISLSSIAEVSDVSEEFSKAVQSIAPSPIFMVTMVDDLVSNYDTTADKTYKEIYDAFMSGKVCMIKLDTAHWDYYKAMYLITDITLSGDNYSVNIARDANSPRHPFILDGKASDRIHVYYD